LHGAGDGTAIIRSALSSTPEAFAHDPDRLARFTREAQTLAAINHPNIAHIYGLEDADGRRFVDALRRLAPVKK